MTMLYWGSSSKVGVQPTAAANNKQKKRSERFSRKGITMEDLKKQTALRLAQEQNRHSHKQGGYIQRNIDNNGGETRRPSPPVAPSPSPPAREPPAPNLLSNDPYRDAHYHHQYANVRPVSMPTCPSEFLGSSHGPSAYNRGPVPSISSFPEMSNTKQKSKLPHGLTVQELKEMTKARLQAEAASKGHEHPVAIPKRHPDSVRTAHTPEPRPNSRGTQPSPIPPCFALRPEASYMPRDRENWEASQYMAPSYSEASPLFARSSSFPNPPTEFEIRRRAATKSPRLQPRLQPYALHEDHEVDSFPFRARAFSPEHRGGRERAFTSYEPREQQESLASFKPRERAFSSEPGIFPQQHQSAFTAPGNRARTSSAASVPGVSNSSEEFDLDVPQESSLRFHGSFRAVREEAPVSPVLSDVFRVSSFERSPVLSMENRMHASTWSGEHPQDSRMRTSTWSEPGSIFGSAGDMGDDLASILKLSGAEEKNHY